MAYKFVVEEYKNEGFKQLYEHPGVDLSTAMDELMCFIIRHRGGYLLKGSGHPVEYEVDGAKLSCWIDFE